VGAKCSKRFSFKLHALQAKSRPEKSEVSLKERRTYREEKRKFDKIREGSFQGRNQKRSRQRPSASLFESQQGKEGNAGEAEKSARGKE